MKRQIAKLVIAFFLVSILTGCSAPKSTVTAVELTERYRLTAWLVCWNLIIQARCVELCIILKFVKRKIV